MVDSILLVGSSTDSQSGSGVELDFGPDSIASSGFVVDYESVTSFDYATEERSRLAIL